MWYLTFSKWKVRVICCVWAQKMRIKQGNILYDSTHLVLLAISIDWLMSKPFGRQWHMQKMLNTCGTKATVNAEYVHNIGFVSHVNGIAINIMGSQSFMTLY